MKYLSYSDLIVLLLLIRKRSISDLRNILDTDRAFIQKKLFKLYNEKFVERELREDVFKLFSTKKSTNPYYIYFLTEDGIQEIKRYFNDIFDFEIIKFN